MKQKLKEKIDFEKLLQAAAEKPYVHVDRESFLRKELKKYRTQKVVEEAVRNNPAYAGIPVKIIHKIASGCIREEALKTGVLSFGAGIPGGIAMAATIPADLVQFYAHLLRVTQMLAYLYGWPELSGEKGEEEDNDLITLFTGVMFEVSGAKQAVQKIGGNLARETREKVRRKPEKQDSLITTVKNVAKMLGTEMTKALLSMGVSHFLPIAGAVLAGGSTVAGFGKMANRLRKCFESLELADVSYYRRKNLSGGSSAADEKKDTESK